MKRGDIVTVALAGEFGKPRPAVIVQSNHALPAPTITFLPITSDLERVPLVRVPVTPTEQNGLRKESEVMVDLIQTSTAGRIGGVIGHIEKQTLRAIERAMLVYLGLD